MKPLIFTLLFLLLNFVAYAQCLSAKEIIAIAKMAKAENFANDFNKNSKSYSFLRSKGFVSVRWREDDPDFARDLAVAYSYKHYSKSIGSYLVFHSDGHRRAIEEIEYRFNSPIYFTALRKQFKALVGKEVGGKNSDYDESQLFGYTTSRYYVGLRNDVEQASSRKIHHFLLAITPKE